MTAASIQAALDAYLGAQVTDLPIAWEGIHFDPDSAAYLAVRMAARTSEALGPGQYSTIEWSGVYQISVYLPSGGGTGAALLRGDTLCALFRRGLSLRTTDGLDVIVFDSTPMPALVDPAWVHVPVQVNWIAYEVPVEG